MAHAAFHLLDLPEVDLLASSCTTQCQHYYTLETPLHVGGLGLNAFNNPWTFQAKYVFSPPALVPLVLSKFLAEHVKGQTRILILVAPCWMEAPWLPSSQYVSRYSSALSHHKRSHHGCFSRPHAQGSPISAFIPLAAHRCVVCRQGFSVSVCQAVVRAT